MTQEEAMEFDVVIVGAGPAGLSAAVRLRQLSPNVSVCVLEKGSEVGAHILSGAVFETRALDELIPDWKFREAPLNTKVSEEVFLYLTQHHALHLPTPRQMRGKGSYVISLANLCRWLAVVAEDLGVQISPGFPAAQLYMEKGRVAGVITGEFGRAKNGDKKETYQPGIVIKGKRTLFAEGCRGSLAQQLMEQFGLREGVCPQTYGIGIKEIWEIKPENHRVGHVMHGVGWPLDRTTYGGAFLYHLENNQVAVGYVVGLDYQNPYLDPFAEFQRFKTHPAIAPMFAGGRRIAYGAKALNEGGFQSIPKLVFPGGALIGDSAGFLNVPKIRGSHTAMKSGMLAAEALIAGDLYAYPKMLRNSWVYEELHRARNIRPGFHFGLLSGLLYAAIDTYLLRGRAPWTFKNHADHKQLRPAREFHKIDYPKPDGVLTFDKLSSVFLSGTNHEENQPCHLTLKDAAIPTGHNLPVFDAPEQRYCPAAVYEIIRDTNNDAQLQINAQNCVHCKTCDIKDPTQNIVWVPPEGGGGPNYGGM